MPSYLITGSSRGLGLAFAKELLKSPDNFVIATARNPKESKGLQELAAKFPGSRLALLQLDVTDETSIRKAAHAASELLPNGLDNFISNAGIANDTFGSFETINLDIFRSDLDLQVVSTVLLLRTFLPLIRRGKDKKIMALSSVLGSIEVGFGMRGLENTYSVLKASLNMLIRKWASDLKEEGITAFVIHPGWVGATDMGKSIATYMETYAPHVRSVPEVESAEECMKVLKSITLEDAGSFKNLDGSKLPW